MPLPKNILKYLEIALSDAEVAKQFNDFLQNLDESEDLAALQAEVDGLGGGGGGSFQVLKTRTTTATGGAEASNGWLSFSNSGQNSLLLPAGTWELNASLLGGHSSTSFAFTNVLFGFFAANGQNDATAPAPLDTLAPNLVIESLTPVGPTGPVGQTAFFPGASSNGLSRFTLPMNSMIVTATAPVTVFAVPRLISTNQSEITSCQLAFMAKKLA